MNSPNQIYLNQIIPNQIIGGDAFELLPKIKDDSVDLIVCDGPFGVTDQKWDKISDIQQFNLKLIIYLFPYVTNLIPFLICNSKGNHKQLNLQNRLLGSSKASPPII